MQATDVALLRGAALPTAAAGLLAAGIAGLAAGLKGVTGVAIGVAVVMAFFTVSLLAVTYAARISAAVMMQAALATYLVKVLALLGLIVVLRDVTFWNSQAFAWTVIGCTVVWLAAEIRAFTKQKILYVDPDRQTR